MNRLKYIVCLAALWLLGSCTQRPAIGDGAFMERVRSDWAGRLERTPAGTQEIEALQPAARLSAAERDALVFLYAYMPLGDMADYAPEFYLRNVRAAFAARERMAWGRTVPVEVFRHFVLPVRVNNENLDDFRTRYFEELSRRVEGLSLYQAALEVNHWCHEHVTYAPSDSRTSSPVATVRTALGRCGEESTLAVAALRTVGIPARQVYTPRWAHTDDNHAWVEVWVDGRWHFLGACEPEPVLDLAWFNAPASRAMLMHTRVFGRYEGGEDIIRRTPCYTEINVIDNYVDTRRATVRVVDERGEPAVGARVEFKIYNYAEFYPVATLLSDSLGSVSLTTGLGDMLVWASRDDRFGFGVLSSESLTVTLDRRVGEPLSLDFDIVPPPEGDIPAEATPEQIEANCSRLAEEDRLRAEYTATFMTPERAGAECRRLGLDPAAAPLLAASAGNWREVLAFLEHTPAERRAVAVELLSTVSAKDLRDTPESVLRDHLEHTPAGSGAVWRDYVLAPRAADELLSPYKELLAGAPGLPSAAEIAADPARLEAGCAQHIAVADELNPQRIPVSPAGVLGLRCADSRSREIFFVAVCRARGVPARIDAVTGKTQYLHGGRWHDVTFGRPAPGRVEVTDEMTGEKRRFTAGGALLCSYDPVPWVPDPQYYRHFTLSRCDGGVFSALNFESGDATELGAEVSWRTLLSRPYGLDCGYYALTSGTRMASGKVLAHMELFPVGWSTVTSVPLVLRHDSRDIEVQGFIDAEAPVKVQGADEPVSLLSLTGRGYFMVVLPGAGDEPSNHAMREIASVSGLLESWGRKIVVALPEGCSVEAFGAERFGPLPMETMIWAEDVDGRLRKMLCEACERSGAPLPVVAVADSFGRVVFISAGYDTSLGARLTEVIHEL